MSKSLKYLALLALVPLLTAGLSSNYIIDADAAKSQGSNAPGRLGGDSYGSKNSSIVCGDVLCKDYPGGKAGWDEDRGKSQITITPQSTATDTPKPSMTTEGSETSDLTEKDLGSVLRLSRANVPAEIPMHTGFYDGGKVH